MFSYFSKAYKKADVEYVCVITAENKVYEVKGISSTVGINLVGDTLKGAYVTHNHPDQGEFFGDCFSKADFKGFFKYGLKELQVSSGLGRYSISYDGNYISEKEAEALYNEARKNVFERAFQNGEWVEYEQFDTMEFLSGMMKNLVFKRIE